MDWGAPAESVNTWRALTTAVLLLVPRRPRTSYLTAVSHAGYVGKVFGQDSVRCCHRQPPLAVRTKRVSFAASKVCSSLETPVDTKMCETMGA
jgi:hypothetical protein